MKKLDESLINKIKNIKLVITDMDGVLTDGGLYYTSEGLVMKKFNVKDGMGTLLLRKADIKVGIISTDTTEIINKRAERLKMDFACTGIWNKAEKMLELCEEYKITPDQVAFIGDDVNDIEIIEAAGLTFAPKDALPKLKNMVDLVLKKKGGKGCFREMSELILKYTNTN
ncbi:MAG: HAD-IIIA family hydrolase [Melioribacteraceae bacterium]|nr:HAD-IIIA family hydrolase [Melioribacteraceae bacterium]